MTGSIWDVGMEKDGAYKMDRQNKKNELVLENGEKTKLKQFSRAKF